MDNDGRIIKNFISDALRKKNHLLSSEEIEKQIEDTRKMAGPGMGTEIVKMFYPEFSGNWETDWNEMKRELESIFNVKMDIGFTLEGISAERDKTWWTGKAKQKKENFYWNRYREYLSTQLPGNIVSITDKDSDAIMNNIENPEIQNFERYGMVVGHVQSGKTSSYSALVCKAADAGYKFIVIIAGGMDNLRNQTQKRLLEAFVGHNRGVQVGAGKGNHSLEKQPISLTTADKDFNKADADKNSQGINLNNTNVPILLVIKKNTSILKNVTDWLKTHYKNRIKDFPMLVIDDESDYASVNTSSETDPTSINKGIRNLLSLFYKSSYVAYTATPFANIFIDYKAENQEQGKDLFPRDFIHVLDAPSNYFGAEKIFGNQEEDGNFLTEIDDNQEYIPLKHKKDFKIKALPESLKEAVRLFLINVALRHLRGQQDKHNSMLIHISINTGVHESMAYQVESYLEKLKKAVLSYGKIPHRPGTDSHLDALKETFEKYYSLKTEKWDELSAKIHEIIMSIIIREVHQKASFPLEYRDDIPTNAIVIGGASLSRGYTLEGLSVTYFLRNTLYYDTLMQMGRWFGYRPGYEDLCRIYMTEDMMMNFRRINESVKELYEELKKMCKENRTPEEFGLAVKVHPDSALQITARNKQKNAKDYYIEMDLSGTIKQTIWLVKEEEEIVKNRELTEGLIRRLNTAGEREDKKNKYVWRNIDKSLISEYIEEFKVYKRDSYGFTSHLPLGFIKEYIKESSGPWDVALFSKGGDADISADGLDLAAIERKMMKTEENCYRLKMLSGSSDEGIALLPEDLEGIENNRIEIRKKIKNPLLMLYFVKSTGGDSEDEQKTVMPAYGISFPGRKPGESGSVKLKINSVYLDKIISEQELENEEEL